MNNSQYVSPRGSAYCPECKTHPQQIRTRNHGERLCSNGHTFTLEQSRKAEGIDRPAHAPRIEVEAGPWIMVREGGYRALVDALREAVALMESTDQLARVISEPKVLGLARAALKL